jgi:hypothetical protein
MSEFGIQSVVRSDGPSGERFSKVMGMIASGFAGDKTAVLAQLERILASSAFRNSKRHSNFFRHIVERAVAGGAADLKERSIGVEVFGRSGDYDNNADPIVRVAAGEVRKRIAQYYHEPGREREIRIELPLGSYIPGFLDPILTLDEPVVSAGPPIAPVVPPPGRSRRLLPILVCAGILAAALAWWRPWVRSSAFDRFWRPFLDGGSPVTICVARVLYPAATSPPGAGADRPGFLAWPDFSTATKVACLFAAAGQPYQLRRDDNVNFEDLRHGPAILIGAFNDVWTIRLTENLRFEFQNEGSLLWILDRKNPSSRAWSVDYSGSSARNRDYAVISRLLTGRSGSPVLTIAGIGGNGTEIAGEFVTNRTFLEAMAGKAPAGWQRRNMQVVIETEVIDGHAGPPRLEAIDVW